MEVLPTLESFHGWLPENPGAIAHIKGFGGGIPDNRWKKEALQRLQSFNIFTLVWDGDSPKESSFTALVTEFLRANPSGKAVAFKKNTGVEKFCTMWAKEADEFPGRILVVAIDVEKDAQTLGISEEVSRVQELPMWAQEFFLLGRVAIKATGSKMVICVGGGGITGQEADASFEDGAGIQWTVFAVSRGKKEQYPSMLDWAATASSPHVEFVHGLDEQEADGYSGDMTPGSGTEVVTVVKECTEEPKL